MQTENGKKKLPQKKSGTDPTKLERAGWQTIRLLYDWTTHKSGKEKVAKWINRMERIRRKNKFGRTKKSRELLLDLAHLKFVFAFLFLGFRWCLVILVAALVKWNTFFLYSIVFDVWPSVRFCSFRWFCLRIGILCFRPFRSRCKHSKNCTSKTPK